jgi:hypothetical protein
MIRKKKKRKREREREKRENPILLNRRAETL